MSAEQIREVSLNFSYELRFLISDTQRIHYIHGRLNERLARRTNRTHKSHSHYRCLYMFKYMCLNTCPYIRVRMFM